ncbi:conserved hypothetical protein [Methanolacinia petrolearia DSM 11571]|jgi:hypothetical protein|uniref:Uncharacterized protein n=1 Tax=Methanolacinia petrolearia (strain DSM 11571 / OCM 486 / SEBR 4847) TaxID=679926 RepID=E1RFJ6_METP4|nr:MULTISPECIES: hypothetical protein [Methanolacinia]ADN36226.1 conserved hypothetical protein [Methanolacinia petrolearia DSM 11571]
MSKVIRIDEDSIEIAMKYGKSISEGIRTMDKMIHNSSRNTIDAEDIRRVVREELESFGRY